MNRSLPLILLCAVPLTACSLTDTDSGYRQGNGGGGYVDPGYPNNAQYPPTYPGGQPYPPADYPDNQPQRGDQSLLAAVDNVEASLRRTYDATEQYGDTYRDLQGDLRNMGRQINDVQERLRRNESPHRVREAYREVESAAGAVDARLAASNPRRNIRESWADTRNAVYYTARILDPRDNNYTGGPGAAPGPVYSGDRRPAPPPQPPQPFADTLATADVLVGSIDGYLAEIKDAQRPEAVELKRQLQDFRGSAELFRTGIRGGAGKRNITQGYADLANRWPNIRNLYSRCVGLDRRFAKDNFARADQAMGRIPQTLR